MILTVIPQVYFCIGLSFRIIYRISSDRIIEIVAVGPREPIYEETFRIFCKKEK
jgi:hypothetical protein